MGVAISDILVKHETKLKDHKGERVSIDGYNIIYQFLSSIRQPDGTALMDHNGHVTSHLSGLFYRTMNLIDAGIKPIYVFDGKPSVLKNRTIEERRLIKEKAKIELEEAIAAGEQEKIRSLSSRINYISKDMVDESIELLNSMGIPSVTAPSEGEAFASAMCLQGLVNGVVSQDYDCLLFGAPTVYRNFTLFGRRKVPGRSIYVNVSPEVIYLRENLETLGTTREQLIYIGIMVGTDFNKGLKKVGAKTALKLIKKYGDIHSVLKERNETIDNLDEVIELFMNKLDVSKVDISLRKPDGEKILGFLCDRHDFSPERIKPYIETLESSFGNLSQSSLDIFGTDN